MLCPHPRDVLAPAPIPARRSPATRARQSIPTDMRTLIAKSPRERRHPAHGALRVFFSRETKPPNPHSSHRQRRFPLADPRKRTQFEATGRPPV